MWVALEGVVEVACELDVPECGVVVVVEPPMVRANADCDGSWTKSMVWLGSAAISADRADDGIAKAAKAGACAELLLLPPLKNPPLLVLVAPIGVPADVKSPITRTPWANSFGAVPLEEPLVLARLHKSTRWPTVTTADAGVTATT